MGIVILFLSILFFFPNTVEAISDPRAVPNNKYGIHITDMNDLNDAAALINSTGGDWGYVTLVIQDGDRNVGKWQETFNAMRRLHLIPLLRLATHPTGDSWKIPQKEDANRWASFLDSLLWPVANRYVILFNEPNHAKEWGNTINPEEYADVASVYAQTLKDQSSDFFILPAGLDSAASSDGEALEASEYIKRMYAANPELFMQFDGWTSHSYPNPGFSGSPFASGKGTIASFRWELTLLQTLGVTKSYPIFITETGWVHNQGFAKTGVLTPDDVGKHLLSAATDVWQDPRIAAITPFILNYQARPFDQFSWKKVNTDEFLPHYAKYQNIPKEKGMPKQHESYALAEPLIPDTLVTNSVYTLEANIENTGQGILNPIDRYEFVIEGLDNQFTILADTPPLLEPKEKGVISLHMKTPATEQTYDAAVFIKHGDKKIPIEKKSLTLIPPPTMGITTRLGWKKESTADHATVLIYDYQDRLMHKFQDLTITNGSVSVTGLYNMVPGEMYRVVLLVPFYLPRQQLVRLENGKTTAVFKYLIPFDFNRDGACTIDDLPTLLFTKPNEVFSRFF